MAEYDRIQKKQESRVIQPSCSKHLQFLDNRNTRMTKRNSLIQHKLAEPASVARDMCYARDDCFENETKEQFESKIRGLIEQYKYFPPSSPYSPDERDVSPVSKNIRDQGVKIPVVYKPLGWELPEGKELIAWLNDGAKEHMWINDNTASLKVASRYGDKLPHPALAGGDPDVSGAGLMYINPYNEKQIIINNRSGHFRPSNVDQDSVNKLTNALDPKDDFSVLNFNP